MIVRTTSRLYEEFASKICGIAGKMRQGPPLNDEGNTGIDIGAMCLPGEVERIQALVDDAVKHGAKVGAGGKGVKHGGAQFYQPTVMLMADAAACRGAKLLSGEVASPLAIHPLCTFCLLCPEPAATCPSPTADCH